MIHSRAGFGAPAWKIRKSWADAPRGMSAADLARVTRNLDLWVIRNIARQHMKLEDFEVAVSKEGEFGDRDRFWKSILTGTQRIVLSYYRHVYGCGWNKPSPYYSGPPFIVEKRVECFEKLVWPPEGWQAPLTPQEFDVLTAIPEPGAEDDGGLAAKIDAVLSKCLK